MRLYRALRGCSSGRWCTSVGTILREAVPEPWQAGAARACPHHGRRVLLLVLPQRSAARAKRPGTCGLADPHERVAVRLLDVPMPCDDRHTPRYSRRPTRTHPAFAQTKSAGIACDRERQRLGVWGALNARAMMQSCRSSPVSPAGSPCPDFFSFG